MTVPRHSKTISFEDRAKEVLEALEQAPSSTPIKSLKQDIKYILHLAGKITLAWKNEQQGAIERVELLRKLYEVKANIAKSLPNPIEKTLKTFEKNLREYVGFIQNKFEKRDLTAIEAHDMDDFLRGHIVGDAYYMMVRTEESNVSPESEAMDNMKLIARIATSINKQISQKKVMEDSVKELEQATVALLNTYANVQDDIYGNKSRLANIILAIQFYRREVAEILKDDKIQKLKFEIIKLPESEITSISPPSSSRLSELLKMHGKFSSRSSSPHSPLTPDSPTSSTNSTSDHSPIYSSWPPGQEIKLSQEFDQEDQENPYLKKK